MKNLLSTLAVSASLAFTMAACNTQPQQAQVNLKSTDTAGLAAFQAWKQAEMYNSMSTASYAAATPQTRVVTKYVPVRSASTRRYRSSSSSSSRPVVMNSESSNAAKKRGWSKAAKGAVIGGVVGAGTGAVINKKNRAAGAVIGGVLGAGAGYGIGRGMDKKDGRY
jgi:outer membrane lipoprotein SlyB